MPSTSTVSDRLTTVALDSSVVAALTSNTGRMNVSITKHSNRENRLLKFFLQRNRRISTTNAIPDNTTNSPIGASSPVDGIMTALSSADAIAALPLADVSVSTLPSAEVPVSAVPPCAGESFSVVFFGVKVTANTAVSPASTTSAFFTFVPDTSYPSGTSHSIDTSLIAKLLVFLTVIFATMLSSESYFVSSVDNVISTPSTVCVSACTGCFTMQTHNARSRKKVNILFLHVIYKKISFP